MTARASFHWRDREHRIGQSPLQPLWGGELRGLAWFVLDCEEMVVPFWGGTLVEAEDWILTELQRREAEG